MITMASAKQHYPEHLNPFGSDDEDDFNSSAADNSKNSKTNEYPEYLSPFGNDVDDEEELESSTNVNDYDDSLNPFGVDDDDNDLPAHEENQAAAIAPVAERLKLETVQGDDEGNPLKENAVNDSKDSGADKNTSDNKDRSDDKSASDNKDQSDDRNASYNKDLSDNSDKHELESLGPLSAISSTTKSCTSQPASLEPPVPLPRTKSLLKKELKIRQLQQQQAKDSHHTNSLLSTTSSTSSSSITATSGATSVAPDPTSNEQKPRKRNAPPVPVNFKRQVSGSLDAIEAELNDIGDKLAILEKESNLCQMSLTATHNVDNKQFSKSRAKFIQVIKKKNVILRRQKELMYRKRELQLDQTHSDIEYELRMIGNKQLSHRTTEDEIREKDLLKKLVEIVEEKNDIVENLNKDTSCDNEDIEEAFRRLNLTNVSKSVVKNGLVANDNSSSVSLGGENCDRRNTAMGNKLSKIATLLPKSGTLKSTMKIKPKRLFKRSDSNKLDG